MDDTQPPEEIPIVLLTTALQELRRVRGSWHLTRQALLQYFRAGLKMGLEVDNLVHWFFVWPNQHDSTFAQVGYSPKEGLEVLELVQRIPMSEIIEKDEPSATP